MEKVAATHKPVNLYKRSIFKRLDSHTQTLTSSIYFFMFSSRKVGSISLSCGSLLEYHLKSLRIVVRKKSDTWK